MRKQIVFNEKKSIKLRILFEVEEEKRELLNKQLTVN